MKVCSHKAVIVLLTFVTLTNASELMQYDTVYHTASSGLGRRLMIARSSKALPTSKTNEEAAAFDRHHNLNQGNGGKAKELFTDNDPATTIKGCGFKNGKVAELTLRLACQPGCRWKQYWTIRAMLERAKWHPHKTTAMQEAVEVFQKWMDERNAGSDGSSKTGGSAVDDSASKFPTEAEERQQREMLSRSFANAHAKRNCASDKEFNEFAKSDRLDGLTRLRDAAHQCVATVGFAEKKCKDQSFSLPATSFVAIFGGPGEHGYGRHLCEQAETAALLPFRCLCGYRGNHRIEVDHPVDIDFSMAILGLGARFPFREFSLRYDGVNEMACFVSVVLKEGNGNSAKRKRQLSLTV